MLRVRKHALLLLGTLSASLLLIIGTQSGFINVRTAHVPG